MDLSHNCSLHGGKSEVCEKRDSNMMYSDQLTVHLPGGYSHRSEGLSPSLALEVTGSLIFLKNNVPILFNSIKNMFIYEIIYVKIRDNKPLK